MPSATSLIEKCSQIYSELESSADELMEALIRESAEADRFFSLTQKAEEQIVAAKKMLQQNASKDLGLNETAIVADKLLAEIGEAERYAIAAELAEREEEWACELESAKAVLEKLAGSLKKMKDADSEGDALEARSHFMAFRKEAEKCRKSISKLKKIAYGRSGSSYRKLRSLKAKVLRLKKEVGEAFDRISKERLRKRIQEAKEELLGIMGKHGSANIFLDHKHLTISNGKHTDRIPLSQTVRYALEEIAPLQKYLAKLGKNGTVVLGHYRKGERRSLLKIGERYIAGDTVVYKEKSFEI
ncbi:MAG: hypothetical protein N3F07_03310 [Candidatus Micrarchaeota archaeon]|nr:hypothetical protein [Candidatus Micrarchaeota archaeon]